MTVEKSPKNGRSRTVFEWLLCMAVIFLCTGEGVPGINESHYLTKAKHDWDGQFAPGDLFLESHNSHFLAGAVAGMAAWFLPLTGVAWLGRLVSWAFMAWAWLRLRRSLGLSIFFSPLTLASWILGTHFGHWAGEWAVGGFEAKSLAYPCVLLGIAAAVDGRFSKAWIWLGAAVAWHPVVGGWAGLAVGLLWLLHGGLRRELRQQLPWLLAGTAIGLVGVIPAMSGLSGPDVIGNVSAAQVHVYYRLPHHLAPQLFAPERHGAALLSLVVLILVTWLHWRRPPGERKARATRVLKIGWLAVAFAVIGLLIDLTLSLTRPDIAAKLLRFYWFRWADVAVPLSVAISLWSWLNARWEFSRSGQKADVANGESEPDADNLELNAVADLGGRGLVTVVLVLAIGLDVLGLAMVVRQHARTEIPPADRLVVESVGPYSAQSSRYVDWLAVTGWIRQNTPSDSLWFTPKYQQTFKWHAGRAEVYCWKDVPQDNRSVIEWFQRVQRCMPPRDRFGNFRDWTTEQLLELSAEYGFEWVLIDRSYQQAPPALEIVYPVASGGRYVDNRSFAVFRIPTKN